jgi:uncharacterized membrane protein YcaP (DUF421 family)
MVKTCAAGGDYEHHVGNNAVVYRDITIWQAVVGLSMWTLLTFIVEYISLK